MTVLFMNIKTVIGLFVIITSICKSKNKVSSFRLKQWWSLLYVKYGKLTKTILRERPFDFYGGGGGGWKIF